MFAYADLSPEQRERVKRDLQVRIKGASEESWRQLWSADLFVLERRTDEAYEVLTKLAEESSLKTVAMHARLGLGRLSELRGDLAAAEFEYRIATDVAPTAEDKLRCIVDLGRVLNSKHEYDSVEKLLIPAVRSADTPPELAQFVMIELGTAMIGNGKVKEAAAMFDAMISRFHNRLELIAIREHLLES